MGGAAFIEIVQTLSALIGMVLAFSTMINADLNLIAIVRTGLNGNRRMIATRNVRTERCVVVVQLALFLAGLTTLFLAPPPYSTIGGEIQTNPIIFQMEQSVRSTRFWMTVCSLVLTYLSYRNWLEERLPVRAMLKRQTDSPSDLVAMSQDAASKAQVSATVAQDAASAAQTTATVAQDEANIAHHNSNNHAG
jgi:hypothetical protein